jgi:hypothetical protein
VFGLINSNSRLQLLAQHSVVYIHNVCFITKNFFLHICLQDWDRIVKFRPSDSPSVSDISNDRKTWVILYSSDNRTSRYYLYHPGYWPPQLLFEVQPALNPFTLSRMHPVVITARDGLRLPSYLSLPVLPGVPSVLPASVTGEVPTVKNSIFASANDTAASNNPDRSIHWAPKPESAAAAALAQTGGSKPLNLSLPLVLYVHGGPWSRDYWGADSVVQWLNNRGYAVLQVNFRGSTGKQWISFRRVTNIVTAEHAVCKLSRSHTRRVWHIISCWLVSDVTCGQQCWLPH